jgi:hypothetical protein
MNRLFKSGDLVCTKVNPLKALKVRLYARHVYYCDVYNRPGEKEEIYFEKELELYKTTT